MMTSRHSDRRQPWKLRALAVASWRETVSVCRAGSLTLLLSLTVAGCVVLQPSQCIDFSAGMDPGTCTAVDTGLDNACQPSGKWSASIRRAFSLRAAHDLFAKEVRGARGQRVQLLCACPNAQLPPPGSSRIVGYDASYDLFFGSAAVRASSRSLLPPIQALPVLGATATPDADPAAAGSLLTYVVDIDNSSAVPAQEVSLRDVLPQESAGPVRLLAVRGSQGACSSDGREITCNLGALAPAAQARVEFDVLPTEVGATLHNTAIVAATSDQGACILSEVSLESDVAVLASTLPVVTVERTTNSQLAEGSAFVGQFIVTRSTAPPPAPPPADQLIVQVHYTGTVDPGSDLEFIDGFGATLPAAPTAVVIAPGETTGLVTFRVVDDALSEGIESIEIVLDPSSDYAIGSPDRASATILDNE